MSAIHIADTGLFLAMGQPSNERYRAVRRFAQRNDIVFVVPERVYAELTADASGPDPLPVDVAIQDGWTRVAEPLTYSHGLVSRTMDGVQRYIANADDRPADEVERADAALAGLAAHAFAEGTATRAFIYTTDRLAGEGAEAVFASEGYGDSFTYIDGFRFLDELTE
ncbi:hypothetical protein ACFPYI_21560 [Halomarina salina]|uniref:PIN domain-containing protein n=1 Tax=Halomarina salina TaxID=1872699 RepID=A0ABD5RUW3_9EURY